MINAGGTKNMFNKVNPIIGAVTAAKAIMAVDLTISD